MLRASGQTTGRPTDLRAIVDPLGDPLLPVGAELLAFTDAAVLRDGDELPMARLALLERAGPAALIRAAAVAGNFEMMNRNLDAVGVAITTRQAGLASELGLRTPSHLLPR